LWMAVWRKPERSVTPSPAKNSKTNLYHLGSDGLEPMTMVEFRRGRPAERRLALGRAIFNICVAQLGVPRRTIMVEFTSHLGEEILRAGDWAAEWTPAEAAAGCDAQRTRAWVIPSRRTLPLWPIRASAWTDRHRRYGA
jgi:hypothetical protein